MPFKIFPCCVSAEGKGKEEVYMRKEEPTSELQNKEPKNSNSLPRNPESSKSLPKSEELKRKTLSVSTLNATAQKLLLGEWTDEMVRYTKSVKLNIYGVPDCAVFSSVFYQHMLPEIESTCSEDGYEIEVMDLASRYDAPTAVFLDRYSDCGELVHCQGYKRGPFRHFNLIVAPVTSTDCRLLAPVFDQKEWDVIQGLSLSDEQKSVFSQNYEEKHGRYRMKNCLGFEQRKNVIENVQELLLEKAPQSIQDRHCVSNFEQMVNYLFANATDVRETTCVLYLNDSSVDANGSATEFSSRMRTIANTVRAQLPTSSFVEVSQSLFQSSKGQQITKVLSKILQSFCSEHEKRSYVVHGLPHHLHNELLTQNEHLAQLKVNVDSLDPEFRKQACNTESNMTTTFLIADTPFERQIMMANELMRLQSLSQESSAATEDSPVGTLILFRFAACSISFSMESIVHSLKEQMCYLSGKHPSYSYNCDIVQLLDGLLELTDQNVLVAIDDVSDVSWLPNTDSFNNRVHFLLTCSKEVNIEFVNSRSVATFSTNANLEAQLLRKRFQNLVPNSRDSSSDIFELVSQFLTQQFHSSCSVALNHLKTAPLMFSQAEMRLVLSLEERVAHSMAVEALYILLSPLLFKVYSTTSQYYRMIKCSQLAQKVSESESKLLSAFNSSSLAKVLEHSLAVRASGVETSNNLLVKKAFPDLLGLSLSQCKDGDDEILNTFGELIESVTPLVYAEYLSSQLPGPNETDFGLFSEAIKSNSYPLSLAANVTYKSSFYNFFSSKKLSGSLTEEQYPFCSKVFRMISESCAVPKVTRATAEDTELRPRKIKIITWLNAEGSKDFITVLLGAKTSDSSPKGRIEVIRVADMKVVRKIDLTKVPVDIKSINSKLCVVNADRVLKAIDLDECSLKVQLKSQLNIDYPCYGIQGPDQVVAMSRNKMYVNGVQLSTNTTNFSFKVGEDRFLNSLIVAPDGSYCACGDTVQKPMPLLIWDLKQQVLIHDIRIPDHEFDMQLAMVSNHYIAVVVRHIDPDPLNFVNVYEFASAYNKYNFHEDASVTSLVLSPDDHNLILGLVDCSVVIHHLGSSDAPIYLTRMHKTPVDTMRCNLDSSILLTCSVMHAFSDRTINLFSVSCGLLLGSFTPETHFTCVEISPAGPSFLYGTNENAALIKVGFDLNKEPFCKNLPSDEAVFGSAENEGKHSSI